MKYDEQEQDEELTFLGFPAHLKGQRCSTSFLHALHFRHLNVEKHDSHRSENGETEEPFLLLCQHSVKISHYFGNPANNSVTLILMTETPNNILQNNRLFHLFYALCYY